MSSLAATQADGYYVPVEYYESGAYKKQSKNQWNDKQQGKSKPTGPPVVRFELPYSGTCAQCGHFILRGTRYNATKTKAGLYHSSTIWEFEIKCRNCCEQKFVIRTNPSAQSFDYVSGITKQQRHLEPSVGTAAGDDSSEEEKEVLGKLERRARGERKVITEREQLEAMQKSSTTLYLQDASRNSAVRARFRVDRKDRKRRRKDAEALGYREGISILDPSVEDQVGAKEVTFGNGRAKEKKSFQQARASSIFDKSTTAKQSTKKRRKKRRESQSTIQPDRISSSSTTNNPQVAPKKKKLLIVGLGTAAVSKPKPTVTSALGGLVDYESDSS